MLVNALRRFAIRAHIKALEREAAERWKLTKRCPCCAPGQDQEREDVSPLRCDDPRDREDMQTL